MGFTELVIGPATSGRTRWFNPSYGLRLLPGLSEPGADEPHNGLIERGEERRAVARRERFGTAGDFAGAAQRIDQFRVASVMPIESLGEGPPVRRQHFRASFDSGGSPAARPP